MSGFSTIASALASETSLTYFFSSANSSIAGYEQMQSLSQYTPAAEANASAVVTTTPTILEEFATNSGYPNITIIPAGTVYFHYEVEKDSGPHSYYTYVELYKRNLAGTETLLLTSDNSSQYALNTRQQVTVSAANLSDITLLTTDRLVVKIYAVMVSNTATITVYYDDNTDSRLQFPYIPADATNFVPYVGATSNVDLGSTYKVINMIDPTDAQDAATKAYVDNIITPNPLAITKTGDFIIDLAIQYAMPIKYSYKGTMYSFSGKWVETINYPETTAPAIRKITTLSFDDLEGTVTSINLSSLTAVTSISFPELKYIGTSFSFIFASSLTSLSMPKLEGMGSSFQPTTSAALTTISLPELKFIMGTLGPSTMVALTSVSVPKLENVGAISMLGNNSLSSFYFPALVYCGGAIVASGNVLTTYDFPVLEFCAGSIQSSSMAGLTTFNFPALKKIGQGLSLLTNNAFNTLTFPALTDVGQSISFSSVNSLASASFPALQSVQNLSISAAPALTTISLPSMVTYTQASGNAISCTSLAALTTVTIGTVGTLKSIGANVTFSGCALDQASVDGILAVIASLDGTNGTTSWGAGKTLTLSGGTNATPSAAGLANKAIIVARGATVTNN